MLFAEMNDTDFKILNSVSAYFPKIVLLTPPIFLSDSSINSDIIETDPNIMPCFLAILWLSK